MHLYTACGWLCFMAIVIGTFAECPKVGCSAGFTCTGNLCIDSSSLEASAAFSNDRVGWSVAVSADGSTAAVGASMDSRLHPYMGSVRIFDLRTRVAGTASRAHWVMQSYLTNSDGRSSDNFGYSVSVSADGLCVLIGSPFHDIDYETDCGAAYVFTRKIKSTDSHWDVVKLALPNPIASDHFGWSVSLSADGQYALIGAPQKNENVGSAFLFALSDTWRYVTELRPSHSHSAGTYGYSVALSGDGSSAIVGAPAETGSGAGYIFVRDNNNEWHQQARIIPNDGADPGTADYFGNQVSISHNGDLAAVGVWSYSQVKSGAAFVFYRRTDAISQVISWIQQDKVARPGNKGSDSDADMFGFSVSLSGDGRLLLVGCKAKTSARNATAFMFQAKTDPHSHLTSWTYSDSFNGLSGSFGHAVALSRDGKSAVVGAPDASDSMGAAFAYVSPVSEDDAGSKLPMIIGITVGSVVFLLLILGFMYWRKKKLALVDTSASRPSSSSSLSLSEGHPNTLAEPLLSGPGLD